MTAAIKNLTHGELDYNIESTLGAKQAETAVTALGIRGTCALIGGGNSPKIRRRCCTKTCCSTAGV